MKTIISLNHHFFSHLSLLLIATTPFFLSAQSLNGNVVLESNNNVVKYGTVDVYRGEKLVSSVLTDTKGNFKVALDTGNYRCEIRFSGCKPLVKNIHIKSDENQAFKIKETGAKKDDLSSKAKTLTERKKKIERFGKKAIWIRRTSYQ